ncbi:MAG TPA: hypothetical protein VFB62_13360 [Polyangiaceae bacterium]|nr:hypothetical protein [Polyangiaceae bacterium]
MRSIEARDDRLSRHARQGYALALRDPGYRATVLERLSRAPEPRDLWTAIPWIWAATLGEPPKEGALSSSAQLAAGELRTWLTSSESLGELRSRWQDTPFDPGSTLRSHPFPDVHAWLLRKM